jgi:hypothetical protein
VDLLSECSGKGTVQDALTPGSTVVNSAGDTTEGKFGTQIMKEIPDFQIFLRGEVWAAS